MRKHTLTLCGLLLLAGTTGAYGQAAFVGAYIENFNSMGKSGTVAPLGWSFYSMTGSHDTFAPADSSKAGTYTSLNMTPAVTANAKLSAVTGPTTQKGSQGYNFGLSASSADRALGTSPTGIAAAILQLSLTNTMASSISSIDLSYDIRRFTTTSSNNSDYNSSKYKGAEEFAGYQLFYSLNNGSSWTNVAALNPTLSGTTGVVVPNSVGVTSVATTTINLTSAWQAGSTLQLRWLDDNAQSPSPDQIIGLDNVSVTAIPEPSAYAALIGVFALGCATIRRRVAEKA